MPLMLASPAIPPSGEIPAQYTCDGADISPPLSWPDMPAGTGSLVLVVEDPDAPSGVFRHWAVFEIPPASRGLDAGYSANRPTAALHGRSVNVLLLVEGLAQAGDREAGGFRG